VAYFDAIKDFGVEKIVKSFGGKNKTYKFLQTHLTGCVKEKNTLLFGEILQIISSKPDSQTGLALPQHRLDKIIHFKTDVDKNSIFGKTALTWAIENNDQYMAMELLKLEHDFHETEKEGLECLRDNLSSHELLPWIFETYSKFYDKTRYFNSLRIVFVELILLSYLPYFMDIYFDITLAKSYMKYSSENFSMTELWSCGDIKLSSSCYERIGSDHATNYLLDGENLTSAGLEVFEDIQNSFNVAFWVTISLLSFTLGFYMVCVAFDSSPSWLRNKDSGIVRCCGQHRILGWCLKTLLVCVCKLLWPFVHCGRQLLYLASPKRSQYKQNLAKSTAIWNNIKIVEYGLESSTQLLLQVWLLRPFLPIIMAWETTELIRRCVSGLANFFSFEIHPACYIEKALVKILLTIFFLSLGISQMRRKPGQSLLKTLPMFVSIMAQTVGRIVALKSLVLMTTPLGYMRYILFFIVHVLLVFLIKTLFEVNSLANKIGSCCLSQKRKKHIWKVIKFIASCISSTIVMIHLSRDKEEWHKRRPSFLSHSCYHLLILLENLLMVCFPYLAPVSYFPPADCFPAESKFNSVCIVVGMWLVGAVAQALHYKFCSPLSELNGPRATSYCCPSKTSCLATLCWKKELQRIEVKKLLQLVCEDHRQQHATIF
jgi:hypothetical protein